LEAREGGPGKVVYVPLRKNRMVGKKDVKGVSRTEPPNKKKNKKKKEKKKMTQTRQGARGKEKLNLLTRGRTNGEETKDEG